VSGGINFNQREELWTNKHLNQGYGTDIAHIILDFGFGTVGLQRIYLTCSAEDPRSVRCYQKAGYVLEGRQRHAHRRDGRLTDALMMSVLREEWEALQVKQDE
jgi:RimJ/RimL family protein N-acetyltransferase